MVRAAMDLPGDRRLRLSLLMFERAQGLPGPGALANPSARLGTSRVTAMAAYESNDDLGPGGRLRATAYGNTLWSHFADPYARINAFPTDARDLTYTTGGIVDWRRPEGRRARACPDSGGSQCVRRWSGRARGGRSRPPVCSAPRRGRTGE